MLLIHKIDFWIYDAGKIINAIGIMKNGDINEGCISYRLLYLVMQQALEFYERKKT